MPERMAKWGERLQCKHYGEFTRNWYPIMVRYVWTYSCKWCHEAKVARVGRESKPVNDYRNIHKKGTG